MNCWQTTATAGTEQTLWGTPVSVGFDIKLYFLFLGGIMSMYISKIMKIVS